MIYLAAKTEMLPRARRTRQDTWRRQRVRKCGEKRMAISKSRLTVFNAPHIISCIRHRACARKKSEQKRREMLMRFMRELVGLALVLVLAVCQQSASQTPASSQKGAPQ